MESIRQAVERARARRNPPKSRVLENLGLPLRRIESGTVGNTIKGELGEIELDSVYLHSNRIVAHNGADILSRPYDMLRTQVLQSMELNGWKILGLTSPTPGCGKTVTAANLAFSIARLPNQSVVLADLDLQKPRISDCLGLVPAGGGVLGLLQGGTESHDVTVSVRAANLRISVLPTASTRESSELMGSHAMRNLLQDLRREYRTIILDLPPILTSDDVLALVPQVDCILLVAAVGHSKASEVEESMRHLRSSQLVRLVLNKATDPAYNYYYGL